MNDIKQLQADLALLIKDQKETSKNILEALSDILALQQEHNIKTDALLRRLGVLTDDGTIQHGYDDNTPDRSGGYFAGAEPEDDSSTVESGATSSDASPQTPAPTSPPQAPTDAQEPQGTSQATAESQAAAARAASYEAKKKRLGYLLMRAYKMVEYLENQSHINKPYDTWWKDGYARWAMQRAHFDRTAELLLESETVKKFVRELTQD